MTWTENQHIARIREQAEEIVMLRQDAENWRQKALAERALADGNRSEIVRLRAALQEAGGG